MRRAAANELIYTVTRGYYDVLQARALVVVQQERVAQPGGEPAGGAANASRPVPRSGPTCSTSKSAWPRPGKT